MSTTEMTVESGNAVQRVLMRNAFYRRSLHYMLAFSFFVLLFDVLLVGVIFYISEHPVTALYFPADNAGRLIQEIPLSQPNQSNQAVSDWVVKAIEATYSYDFVNYHGQMQDAQQYFTKGGWREYMRGLERSGNLVALKERKLIVTAKVVEPPTLVKVGLMSNGRLAWKFDVPVLMRYQGPPFDGASDILNPLIVTVLVARMDVLEGNAGLGILQLNAFAAS